MTWTTPSLILLGLLILGLTGYVALLRRRNATLAAALAREAALAADLAREATHKPDLVHLSHLLNLVTDADWQQYPAVLVKALVTPGSASRSALLAVREQQNLEVLAATAADGEDWDPSALPAVHEALQKRTRLFHPECGELYLPVPEGAEPIGLLILRGKRWQSARLDDEPFLDAVAGLVHLALVDQRTMTRQFSLSTTDGLTGLVNHRHFQQTLSVMLAQSYLEHTCLALIIADIDHFKHVNDAYGHLFGDVILREIGGVVRRTVPPAALAARYGGEEFAVALPGHTLEEAATVAEQIRAAIEKHQVTEPTSGQPLGVTISLGLALYQLGMGKSRLIARADEALYASKQNGRNRVTVLSSEEA